MQLRAREVACLALDALAEKRLTNCLQVGNPFLALFLALALRLHPLTGGWCDAVHEIVVVAGDKRAVILP